MPSTREYHAALRAVKTGGNSTATTTLTKSQIVKKRNGGYVSKAKVVTAKANPSFLRGGKLWRDSIQATAKNGEFKIPAKYTAAYKRAKKELGRRKRAMTNAEMEVNKGNIPKKGTKAYTRVIRKYNAILEK
jgi:hypothetical protein